MNDAADRFGSIYEELFDPVFHFCQRRLASDADTAEDVTEDVFTVVWRLIDKVPAPPEHRIFIFAIAYRQLKGHQRSLWRRSRLHQRLSQERAATALGDSEEDPAAEDIRRAVAKLPDGEREALLLVVCDGFSHADAGKLLGCTANAIAIRLSRARSQLRAELRPAPAAIDGSAHLAFPGGV